jgi:formylglycine-generating enzyme required for sulfatase activity
MRFWSGLTAIAACLVFVSAASADIFGTGDDQITIEFVTISGSSNPTSGYGIVNNDYRMGVYEITNAQWSTFKAEYGLVTGSPYEAYNADPYYTGADVPTNYVSWYEAAQFVNWLNTSTGHQAAYKFTGTQGTSDYTFATWSAAEAAGTNLYRHKDAYYFLPTEDEWVKAAYWNGTNLQTYATTDDSVPVAGIDSNYAQSSPYTGPWAVGSCSEELNGTHDMMGNVWEWMESPWIETTNGSWIPGFRGGSFATVLGALESSAHSYGPPQYEASHLGFRVASSTAVPEPGSLIIWACGGLGALLLRRRRR